jgi:hypothetical protein
VNPPRRSRPQPISSACAACHQLGCPTFRPTATFAPHISSNPTTSGLFATPIAVLTSRISRATSVPLTRLTATAI